MKEPIVQVDIHNNAAYLNRKVESKTRICTRLRVCISRVADTKFVNTGANIEKELH